ncbi:MAG TPA: CHAP domain-containing protein [Rhizomicrobium sp.]|nr:CHAP domain-containing protein [Rhizomicrobium sp.]
MLASADVPVPTARPDGDDTTQVADDATADDSDVAAINQSAALPPDGNAPAPDLSGDDAPRIEAAGRRLSCVEYSRERSGFAIQGDAKTWWAHAEGIYDRSSSPAPNAVMVFAATRAMTRGHVAFVTRLVSDRRIVVDHANWGRDGKIYLNMPVMDVSANNDWSLVRVWDARDGQWGSRVYPIKGFVSARAMAQS